MEKHNRNNIVTLLFFISAFLVLITAVSTGVMVNSLSGYLKNNAEERLIAASRAAAEIVTAEELDALRTPADMDTRPYAELKERLIRFGEDSHLLFVYYMRLTDDGRAQFIIDNDMTDGTVDLSTPPIGMEDAPGDAFDGRTATSGLGNYSEGYSGLLSGYSPVYDESGRVVAVAGVDIEDDPAVTGRSRITAFTGLLIFSTIVVIVSGFLNVFLYRRKESAYVGAVAEATRANRAKSDFLANMSHEIRTPMNAIIGMTSIAKTAADPAEKDRCLEKIDASSAHLLGVINDILDMSKIEANKFELSLVRFRFKEMLDKVGTVNNFRIAQKDQKFTMHVEEDMPDFFIGDDQRLTQVIANLLSNAVKFTPEGGEIFLEAGMVSESEGMCVLRIAVRDTGIGLTQEQMSRLFRSFEQASGGNTSRKFGGTGLGLAISKNIVEMMGGEIRVDSEPGKGATFAFTVRLERGADEPDEASSPSDDEEGGGADFSGLRVMVAEDVEINREIVAAYLQPTSLAIDCAETGAEAVKLFEANPERYSLILMDIQMPEMDGYEATQRIRALNAPNAKTIPIVAMTANVFRDDIERCLAVGMNDHVGKPIDVADLLMKLKKYLRKETETDASPAASVSRMP